MTKQQGYLRTLQTTFTRLLKLLRRGDAASTVARPIYTADYPSFSPFDRVALGKLLSLLDPGFTALEIGSWLGQGSTQVMIHEAASRNGTIYCVDTWKGNSNVQKHRDIVREYDVFGTFLANVEIAGGSPLVKPLLMSSTDAARVMQDASFDLVFIDADHSYATTLEDIRNWLPKVKSGGVLCGHDCEGRPRDFDREILEAGRQEDTVPGNDRFPRVHAGVVLACEEIFGGAQELWAETPVTTSDDITGYSTIWSVRI